MRTPPGVQRLRVHIRGAVQGVGFRPFVFRLASELGLPGWVVNSSSGVSLEVEGTPQVLEAFLLRLVDERPPRALVQGVETAYLEATGLSGFEIRESVDGEKTALVLPDIATCPDCLRDTLTPGNRRYRYPFTNCTNCGPRFTIVTALPYDRPNTTMASFAMCDACRAEYLDPRDRRFHAQPNACAACGPHLELWDQAGRNLASGDAALRAAVEQLRQGAIVGVKGLGGFHLMVDARSPASVSRLRRAKAREEKPFAVMFPSLDAVRQVCEVGEREARLLLSPESPIVLLRRRSQTLADSREPGRPGPTVASEVAPGNPSLGVMVPYTPLHHLLLGDLGFPVVATSGNRSDEPICTDEREAIDRLRGLADVFLVHDRPIARHVDDSIARVVLNRELVLRRARGYAPLPVSLVGGGEGGAGVLGVGAHLKAAVALSVGRNVFVSQHIGDLETAEALAAFRDVIGAFKALYQVQPATVACDTHPDYQSSRWARESGLLLRPVQHHLAHVLACMAENEVAPPVLGVAWDGTGHGPDGTVWGGEFFVITGRLGRRVATFRTFPLPGGDVAVREPRRSALGVLHEMLGAGAWEGPPTAAASSFQEGDRRNIRAMIERGVNTPRTSSVGRLFDAVASLTGVRQIVRYEGQAAMELEYALDGVAVEDGYPYDIVELPVPADGGTSLRWIVDWRPIMMAALADIAAGCPVGLVSARFHNALAAIVVDMARRAGVERVVLSGGCFQNRYLNERVVTALVHDGFRPCWHQRIPPNDGGIALGQVAATAWAIELG